MTDMKKQFKCPRCEKTAEAKKSPFGWRKLPTDELICEGCFNKAYRAVQVTIPIRGVHAPGLTQGGEELAALTAQFRESLFLVWDHCVALANWSITECIRSEPPRLPGQPLPKLTLALYKAFGTSVHRTFWNGCTTSANSVLRFAEAKYREMRFAIYVTHKKTAPTFRSVPYFVPAASWNVREEQQHVILSVPLNGQRVDLQLLNGRKSRYQLKRLAEIVRGTAIAGELMIDSVDGSPSLRRNGMRFRRPGGGETIFAWPVVRITTYIPKIQDVIPREERTLNVFTGATHMLTTQLEGDTGEPWTYNGDEIRRFVIASQVMRHRWAQDTKAEYRKPTRIRMRRNDASSRHNGKYRKRLSKKADEMSANLVNYARRRRVTEIVYDDRCRDYCPDFGWLGFRDLVAAKAAAVGIRFVLASGDVAPPEQESLDRESPPA